ncbi:unnamed protein product, partial [Prorocentrum cordatum]
LRPSAESENVHHSPPCLWFKPCPPSPAETGATYRSDAELATELRFGMALYRLALLALAAMQLPAHAGAHGAEECTVPGACLDEAAVEAAEQGEADALRVELLQSRSSVAARASTESNASSGASSDRTFWFVSRKQCGGVAGVPGNVLWAAQCQPAAWDRTKSVIYMCEGREATNTLTNKNIRGGGFSGAIS